MRPSVGAIRQWAGRGAALVSFLILVAAGGLLTDVTPQALIPVGQDAIIACFSADGRLLATHEPGGSFSLGSGPVRVWDASSGELRFAVADGWSDVSGIRFSPDGRWLIAAEERHHWKMWDALSGEVAADLDLETRFGNYVGTRFTPNSRFLLIQQSNFDGGYDRVQFWDVETRGVRGGIEGAFWSVTFAADGKTLATYDRDRASPGVRIGVWRLGDGDAFATSLRRHDVRADDVTFSPTLDAFAMTTLSADAGPQEVQVRDMVTGTVLARARYEDAETRIHHLSFSNDGRFLIAKAGGGTQLDWKWKITVWDARSGLVNARTFLDESHSGVSPDGRWVALPNEAGVELVDTSTGASRGTFHRAGDYDFGWNGRWNSSRMSSGEAAFAPDSRTMVVTGFDHRRRPSPLDKWVPERFDLLREKMEGRVARLWAVESGRELAAFPGCHKALFSPDGRLLATRHDSDIRVWNVPIRKPLAPVLVGASIVWLALLAGIRMGRWWLARPRARTAV